MRPNPLIPECLIRNTILLVISCQSRILPNMRDGVVICNLVAKRNASTRDEQAKEQTELAVVLTKFDSHCCCW